eukprot:TRINITY_DN167_c0_g2_i1.p1 TRINITY_DN167_c0_g2~~TRINITY_DN167_c0_g2_i1.p1  ORF type:complete len:379 (+),score=91.33 TRINITY_DN167_c0_g2_i1:147-1283(+)
MAFTPPSHPTYIMSRKIGISTCGGDAPGLNSVIRGLTLAAKSRGWDVLGIEDATQGLINLEYKSPNGNVWLDRKAVSDIVNKGGSILGCDNKSDPFHFVKIIDGKKTEHDVSAQCVENFKKLGLDCLVIVGGDGSQDIGLRLHNLGIPVVGCPKTIDNDLLGTDLTFGFDTASQTIVDAVDKIRDTARSHDRVMVVEVMGRDAGWLALQSGIATGADIVLIPEIPYDACKLAEKIAQRKADGNPFCIAVVAEGAKPAKGSCSYEGEKELGKMIRYAGAGDRLACELRELNAVLETRVSVLGYIQRGGAPSAFDRVLGTRFGVAACELIERKDYGKLVVLKGQEIQSVPLKDCTGGQKLVDPNGELVRVAREVGICFGN